MKFRSALLVTAIIAMIGSGVATAHAGQTIGSLLGKSSSGGSSGLNGSKGRNGWNESSSSQVGDGHHSSSQYNAIFAKALNMPPILLAAQESQGMTILQIAQSLHMTQPKLIAKCVTVYKAQLDVQVKKKQLSAPLETAIVNQFKTALPGLITGRHHHHDGEGGGGDDNG